MVTRKEAILKKVNSKNETQFTASKVRRTGHVAASNKPSFMTLTLHPTCGTRLTFGRAVMSALEDPEDIKVSFVDFYIVLRNGKGKGYNLRTNKRGIKILYFSELVNHMVSAFEIKMDGQTTVSFYDGFEHDGAFYINLRPDIPSAIEAPADKTESEDSETAYESVEETAPTTPATEEESLVEDETLTDTATEDDFLWVEE